jgi:hypothetical protein
MSSQPLVKDLLEQLNNVVLLEGCQRAAADATQRVAGSRNRRWKKPADIHHISPPLTWSISSVLSPSLPPSPSPSLSPFLPFPKGKVGARRTCSAGGRGLLYPAVQQAGVVRHSELRTVRREPSRAIIPTAGQQQRLQVNSLFRRVGIALRLPNTQTTGCHRRDRIRSSRMVKNLLRCLFKTFQRRGTAHQTTSGRGDGCRKVGRGALCGAEGEPRGPKVKPHETCGCKRGGRKGAKPGRREERPLPAPCPGPVPMQV